MAKKSVNKTEAVLQFAQANPDAKPKEICEALKKKKIDISPAYVSTILHKAKKEYETSGAGVLPLMPGEEPPKRPMKPRATSGASKPKTKARGPLTDAEKDAFELIRLAKAYISACGGKARALAILAEIDE